jgi:hypothetical protein
MLLFLLHDAVLFRDRLTPALAASWRRRDFGPLCDLAADLAPTLTAFADRYRLTSDERPLLTRLPPKQRFDRRLWRHLTGELLLYAAVESPEFPTAPGALAAFLTSEVVEQAHRGSRDLEFDGVPYRPGRAGLNDVADVARLAAALAAVDDGTWSPDRMPGDLDADERAEELEDVRDCLADLRSMYRRAQQCGHVLVCETM